MKQFYKLVIDVLLVAWQTALMLFCTICFLAVFCRISNNLLGGSLSAHIFVAMILLCLTGICLTVKRILRKRSKTIKWR